MRKIITVFASIPALGVSRSFRVSVGPRGDVHAEDANCFVTGYPGQPVVGVELQTEASAIRRLFEQDDLLAAHLAATREDLRDD